MVFIFMLGFICGLFLFLIITNTIRWRIFIWKSKGRIFRITKEDGAYYPEKKFLRFFFVRLKSSDDYFIKQWSKNDAKIYIRGFLHELEQSKKENELLDFSNQKEWQ